MKRIISALSKTTVNLEVRTASGMQTLKIIVDDSFRERILGHQWFAFVNGDTVILYTDIGTPANPHMMPLANFILGISADIYVEHKDGNKNDFRVANLTKQRNGKG